MLRKTLAPLGIYPRQARLLEAMGWMGPISQVDLASAFGATSASRSTMTDRPLAAGYITRAIDPASRRQKVLQLTDKGRTLLAGIGEAWSAVDDTIRAILAENPRPSSIWPDDYVTDCAAISRPPRTLAPPLTCPIDPMPPPTRRPEITMLLPAEPVMASVPIALGTVAELSVDLIEVERLQVRTVDC